MTEVHCFSHAGLEGSCIARCKRLIVIVLWFLTDRFWYGPGLVNKERFALQCVSLFKLPEIHRQKSSFIACFVQAHCVLHVQLFFRLCKKAFDVRFRSSHQEVVDVSSCLLLDLFLTWFETIEQATVVS